MTFDDLVLQYRNRIVAAKNKKQELEKILREIDGLVYTKSGKTITQEDKRRILEELRKEAIYESVITHAQDNSEFLELLNTTIKALGGK